MSCCFISAPSYGGAIYSYSPRNQKTHIISNKNCLFARNYGDFGGAIALRGPNLLNSDYNMFHGNIAGTGSIITYIPSGTVREDNSIWISNDKVHNNIATEATLHATELSKFVIYNTEFFNNTATDNNAVISIEVEVKNFECFQCNFTENTAFFGGILNILSGVNINISSGIFINNIVNFGKMIELRKSNKSIITDSYFEDNTCSGSPCHIFIDRAIHLFIASCIFVSNQTSQPVNTHVISFSSKNVAIADIQIIGISGSVLETISDGGFSQVKNITFSCPIGHTFLTEYMSLNDLNENLTAQDKTIETNTTNFKVSFLLKCEPCPANHYRIQMRTVQVETQSTGSFT